MLMEIKKVYTNQRAERQRLESESESRRRDQLRGTGDGKREAHPSVCGCPKSM